jgi:hypothetical protein
VVWSAGWVACYEHSSPTSGDGKARPASGKKSSPQNELSAHFLSLWRETSTSPLLNTYYSDDNILNDQRPRGSETCDQQVRRHQRPVPNKFANFTMSSTTNINEDQRPATNKIADIKTFDFDNSFNNLLLLYRNLLILCHNVATISCCNDLVVIDVHIYNVLIDVRIHNVHTSEATINTQ